MKLLKYSLIFWISEPSPLITQMIFSELRISLEISFSFPTILCR